VSTGSVVNLICFQAEFPIKASDLSVGHLSGHFSYGHIDPSVKAKILKLALTRIPDPNRSTAINFVHGTLDRFILQIGGWWWRNKCPTPRKKGVGIAREGTSGDICPREMSGYPSELDVVRPIHFRWQTYEIVSMLGACIGGNYIIYLIYAAV